MSDTVDQVLDSVTSAETSEVVVEEASEEVAVEDPVASEAVEAPVASEAVETPVEEPAPVEEVAPVEEPARVEEPAPVTTQEVVQNVQEILSSTETNSPTFQICSDRYKSLNTSGSFISNSSLIPIDLRTSKYNFFAGASGNGVPCLKESKSFA